MQEQSQVLNEEEFEQNVISERVKLGEAKKPQKDTARLVWASKPRKEPSARDLVFQTAEEVYPNKASGALTSYFQNGKTEISKKPNRLVWGDNLLVMQALLAQGYEGQIDLIYIDPPFNTGESFNFSNKVSIGDEEFEKELSAHERLAYTDTWSRGIDSFLDMLYPRLQLMKRLLSSTGTIYIHCDQNAAHYLKIILDEIFFRENFVNEIIWKKTNSPKAQSIGLGNQHDTIFLYSKTRNFYFEPVRRAPGEDYIGGFAYDDNDGNGPYQTVALIAGASQRAGGRKTFEFRGVTEPWLYSKENLEKFWNEGKIYKTKTGKYRLKMYLRNAKGPLVSDVWWDKEVSPLQGQSSEILNYPTQKPTSLVERVIKASSTENSLVADFFCGSGTTAAVAEKLERRWITTDLSKTSIQVARSRLVNQDSKPFIIENLGNYQRQLVYMHEIKLKEMYSVILNLYGAIQREDRQGLGISKTDRSTLVYVCEPDRPMTARKAVDLAKEAYSLDGRGYKHLVILAWDYEFNYDEDLRRLLASSRHTAEIQSRIIPSDVYRYLKSNKSVNMDASDKITFYEKPYIKVSDAKVIGEDGEDKIVQIKLEQYVIKDNPIRDEEKRKEAEAILRKNYAYLIDFWAVDYDYDNQTFRSRWQAIRDRSSKEPVPISADFRLKKGKKYQIALRVVDVFGNDASITKEINLR